MARMSVTQKTLEHQESLSRMGGDEFAVLLPGVIQSENAVNVAKKIIDVIILPLELDDLELHLGISIGIACYPQDSSDVDEIIHYADLAMYDAKATGTGYSCFKTDMLMKN